ncbi:MAG: sodium/proline symporter [Synergistes jonesii]|uniref:sodium/proline symporter n=1 Tax=Synergistes jonesii TaxID=2754 RepID=UPI002A74DB64|nr:sodium/proline symporter [Synergistes jonesii]MDY2983973.1 sodium/proline symporter [Synergistes jonesii]
MNLTVGVAVVYLLSIFIIGIVSSKYFTNSKEGFYLGDRGFGPLATAISAGATDTSGWIFIGAVGFSYAYGVSTMWMCVGYTVGYFFNYIFLAPPLRRYTNRTGVMSIPHFFEVRYKKYGHMLRAISSVVIAVFFIIYTGAQLTSAGKAFEALIQWDYSIAVVIAAFFGTFYAFFGGYKAVVWTDVLQGCIMMIVLWIFPIYLILHLGGWTSFWSQVHAIDPILVSATGGIKGYAGFAFAFGLFAGGIGEPGQPQILQRFITAKDDKTIISSSVIAVFWVLTVQGGSSLIGLICRIMSPALSDPEYAFPVLVRQIMHPVIAGIVLAAIFAAILSTVDSLIMVVSQTVHIDILEGCMHKRLSDRSVMWVGRVVILIVGIGGLIIALSNVRMVFWFVLYSWAVMGASFAPPLVLGLYWKRITAAGCLAGMVVGAVVTVVWYNIPILKNAIYELVPAMIASILVTIIVSLMAEAPMDGDKQVRLAQEI